MSESEPNKRTHRKKHLSGPELIAQDMEAARLRLKERKQYMEIAHILGFKEATGARDAVMRHINSAQAASAPQLKAEITEDLKEVAETLLEAIRAGKLDNSDRYVRVIERLVKIEGIDAPIEIKVENVEQDKAEAEALVSKFRDKPKLAVVKEQSA